MLLLMKDSITGVFVEIFNTFKKSNFSGHTKWVLLNFVLMTSRILLTQFKPILPFYTPWKCFSLVFIGCRKVKFTWNKLNHLGVRATTVMSLLFKKSYFHFEEKQWWYYRKLTTLSWMKSLKIFTFQRCQNNAFFFTSIKEIFRNNENY